MIGLERGLIEALGRLSGARLSLFSLTDMLTQLIKRAAQSVRHKERNLKST